MTWLTGSLQELSTNDIIALLYTSIFGSAVSYGVYFYSATKGSILMPSCYSIHALCFRYLMAFMMFLTAGSLTKTQITWSFWHQCLHQSLGKSTWFFLITRFCSLWVVFCYDWFWNRYLHLDETFSSLQLGGAAVTLVAIPSKRLG